MTYIPQGATAANQTTENADLTSIDSKTPALVSGRVPVDPSGVTSPVSAASLPLPAGAATEASLGTDGASPPTIPGTGIRGWLRSIYDKLAGSIAVTGTFWQATQPVSAASLPLPSGASTEATLALIKAKTDNLDVALSTRTKPSDTQPVSAASLPLPAGAATEASLGTDGATPPTIPGTGIRGWLRSIYDKLSSSIAVTGTFWQATQPVSGTVTANAGTNLNTSALALESGGNLATLAGAVSSAKVQENLAAIAGTTVDTNSGTKSAGTQRVVLATDQPALTNALKVDPSGVTSPVSLASLPALAAGTNLIGTAASPSETSTVYNGTTALTPKFAKISTSSSGASQVVAAVTSKKIRVLRLSLIANAAVNVKFQSHVTPTDLTGLYYLGANGGWVEPFCAVGLFETVAGEALDINLSGAVAVGGCLTYVEV